MRRDFFFSFFLSCLFIIRRRSKGLEMKSVIVTTIKRKQMCTQTRETIETHARRRR